MSTQHTPEICKKTGLFEKLTTCIKLGRIRKLKYLLHRYRVNPSDLCDTSKTTLLHIAATYNRKQIAMYLIDQGSSIYFQNSRNECPYYIAVLKGSKKVLKYMERMK